MAKFKEGDRVQVKVRQPDEQEAREGRYAPYLAGATGTILKIYDSNQIAVRLDIESLPEEVRQRHAEQQEAMYRRWFDSLSEEARNRLTDEEKAFHLNYVVLLAEKDMESPSSTGSLRKRGELKGSKAISPGTRGQSKEHQASASPAPRGTIRGGAKQAKPAGEQTSWRAESPKPATRASTGHAKTKTNPRPPAKAPSVPPAPARPTPEQLDLMEEAYLKARQRKPRV